MKATKGQLRSGFTLVELLVVISIIVVLAGLAVPTAMKALGKADQVKGINNAKQIKNYLELFAGDYDGEYPSDDTGEEILELTDDNIGSGSSSKRGSTDQNRGALNRNRGRGNRDGNTASSSRSDRTSNYYFQQLIASGTMGNEEILFLKAYKKAFRLSKPNNDKTIDQGENVWAYTTNLQQTSGERIPIVYDSPISTGDKPRFSKKIWDGKTIMVSVDNSVRAEKIAGSDKGDGVVTGKIDGDRINLFSPEALEEGILVPADLKRVGSNG